MAARRGLLQYEFGSAAKLVPLVTTLLFAIASAVPLPIPRLAVVTPAFTVMAVYHWTLYRPDLLPPLAVFVAGLLIDFLSGTPYVGLSSLAFLLAQIAISALRSLFGDRLFPVVWAGFLAVAAGITFLQWAMVSALHGAALGPGPFVFQVVLTVALFPLGSYVLARLQRLFLPQT